MTMGMSSVHSTSPSRVRLSLAALAVDTAAAFRFIDRALVLLGEDPQSVSQRLVMLSNKISALIGADRIDEARLAVREFVAISDRGVTLPRFTHTVPIWLAYLTGEWDDAVIGLETVFELEGEPDRTDYEAIWTHGLRALIAVHRDDRAVATWHAAVTPQLPEGTIPNNAVYLVLAKAPRAVTGPGTHRTTIRRRTTKRACRPPSGPAPFTPVTSARTRP